MIDHHHPAQALYQPLIDRALQEDIGHGDITTRAFIAGDAQSRCQIVARESATLCGVEVARHVCATVSDALTYRTHIQDGEAVQPGQSIASIAGNAQLLLQAERVMLNFLSYLSGIATYTAACVAELGDSRAQILDTRKTLPAYRDLAKYAVRCGGGRNHRMRLDDGVMIKDNHIALAGGIANAVAHARRIAPALTKIEVECDTLAQVNEALTARADVIMLDNMSCAMMREAVALVDGRIPLEASGGVTLERLAEIAATGVDAISLGALTHSVRAIDFGLDI